MPPDLWHDVILLCVGRQQRESDVFNVCQVNVYLHTLHPTTDLYKYFPINMSLTLRFFLFVVVVVLCKPHRSELFVFDIKMNWHVDKFLW